MYSCGVCGWGGGEVAECAGVWGDGWGLWWPDPVFAGMQLLVPQPLLLLATSPHPGRHRGREGPLPTLTSPPPAQVKELSAERVHLRSQGKDMAVNLAVRDTELGQLRERLAATTFSLHGCSKVLAVSMRAVYTNQAARCAQGLGV